MNKLQEIHEKTLERINQRKTELPQKSLIGQLQDIDDMRRAKNFEAALQKNDVSFICEIKKASPSKGVIAQEFDCLSIAEDYENAGAAAISVLTEPFYFLGKDEYLREIAEKVKIPLLRKDFFVDEYMIYEAKILGASAILLICAMLDKSQIKDFLAVANEIGLAALVETHDENEIETALEAGAKIIGVNNRNLKTFETDISLTQRLRPLVPKDKIFVSESGIKTPNDIRILKEIGANAALIGETFMRSSDKISALKSLRGENP